MMLFGERDLVSLEGFFRGSSHATVLMREGGFSEQEEDVLAGGFLGSSSSNLLKLMAVEGKKGVGVEQVRVLSSSLGMAAKRGGERRLVIVSDRFVFGVQAQNAFLKILEEPPEGVYFLLLANSEGSFLPTIISRASSIKLVGPSQDEAAKFLVENVGLDATDARMLYLQSGGSVAEILRLSSDESARKDSLEILGDAKRFLTQDSYERIVTINKYQNRAKGAAKRDGVSDFLRSLLVVLELASSKGAKEALRFADLAQNTERSLARLKLNANSKVELMSLVG
jgi:DNA polymerase III, delta subunit